MRQVKKKAKKIHENLLNKQNNAFMFFYDSFPISCCCCFSFFYFFDKIAAGDIIASLTNSSQKALLLGLEKRLCPPQKKRGEWNNACKSNQLRKIWATQMEFHPPGLGLSSQLLLCEKFEEKKYTTNKSKHVLLLSFILCGEGGCGSPFCFFVL